MHELGIASEILGIAISEAARHDAKKVTAVRIRVGVLRGIVPEHLVFLFEHLSRGTIADGASLEVEGEPVVIECETCGPAEAQAFAWECPTCKRTGVRASGGDSLSVSSLDLDV